jgi:hypothetical protein
MEQTPQYQGIVSAEERPDILHRLLDRRGVVARNLTKLFDRVICQPNEAMPTRLACRERKT